MIVYANGLVDSIESMQLAIAIPSYLAKAKKWLWGHEKRTTADRWPELSEQAERPFVYRPANSKLQN